MLHFTVLVSTVALAGIANGQMPTAAQLNLRHATSFAILAGSSVINSGFSSTNGSVGVAPGSTVTGFPPGTVSNGSIHRADITAYQAQEGVSNAYLTAARLTPTASLTGQNLGGQTLVGGVYSFAGPAALDGTVTLDGQGNPNSHWVFQIGSTLTTGSASAVQLINGASSCNVYWQVAGSANIGTLTSFIGNILAQTSITASTGASFRGGLYARSGFVTLDTSSVGAGLGCFASFPRCLFKQKKCGYNLVPHQGYNEVDLVTAANWSGPSIPPLTGTQLRRVLYLCNDTLDHILANSYCAAGCRTLPGLHNDMCAL